MKDLRGCDCCFRNLFDVEHRLNHWICEPCYTAITECVPLSHYAEVRARLLELVAKPAAPPAGEGV